MAKRSHTAHRGTRRTRQGRPQTPDSLSPVAASDGDADKNALVGAIQAAADSLERTTVPEIPVPRKPVSEQVDPMASTIVGHPIVDVAPAPESRTVTGMVVKESRSEAPKDSPAAVLDDLDAAFFAQPTIDERELRPRPESFPPVADDIFEPKKAAPPSPELLARRSRLRKVVVAVVALAAVVVIGGLGKKLIAGERPLSSLQQNAAAVVQEPATPAPAVTEPPVAEPVVAAPAAAPEAEPAAAEPAVPEPAVAAELAAPAVDERKPEAPPAVAVAEGVDAKAEALRLLNMGKTKDAIPMAKAAIAADPSDALPYLYLGSALQELGKQKDAIDVYSDCVRNATKGRVWECRAMGGKK